MRHAVRTLSLLAGLIAGAAAIAAPSSLAQSVFQPSGVVSESDWPSQSSPADRLQPLRLVLAPEDRFEGPDQQSSGQSYPGQAASEQVPAGRTDLGGGLSILPPQGWRPVPANPGATVLAGPDGESLIIVSVDEGLLEMAVAELADSIDLGDGVMLDPVASPTRSGQTHSNRFTVRGAVLPTVASVMIRDVGAGRTVSLIGLAPATGASGLQTALNQLMTSLTVGRAPPQSASGWGAQLKGRYLVRFYSGNGYSEKHELWLCSNGSFLKRVDGGGFTQGVASGAFAGGLDGTWTAQGSPPGAGQLVLSTRDGQVLRYTLQSRSDGIGIDGERWMRGDNERCA
jgi:hypothetical protein